MIQARLLNALRETQVEHGRMLAEHGAVLEHHARVLNHHTKILDLHSVDLSELRQGQGTIIGMLTTLIDRESPQ